MSIIEKIPASLRLGRSLGASCHGGGGIASDSRLDKLGIVGNPNVGKSLVFNNLTGAHATVKVAYIYTPKLAQLRKLTAMSILPGASISVLQSFPAHVFQVGQTQFAVDGEIADAIYVRLSETDAPVEGNGHAPKKQRRLVFWANAANR